jgi:succinate dehydrogenase / fumarate reductase cytochrome b subunit
MSPHVSIWKWHMTMASSILHRVTGCAIYVGAFLIVAWLFAAASGPDLYEPMASLIGSIWGQLILFGFTLAMSYHLLNGLRHLSMDAGKGFNPKFASFTAGLVLVLAVALSVGIWMLAGLGPGVDPLNMTTVAGAAQ